MLPYWVGPLLSKLIDSAGVRVTIVLMLLGGGIYLFVLIARYVASLFERILTTRDRERADFAAQQNRVVGVLLERVAEADKRRSELESETAKSLVNIANTNERTANELGRFRDESGAKLGELQRAVDRIDGKVS